MTVPENFTCFVSFFDRIVKARDIMKIQYQLLGQIFALFGAPGTWSSYP